MLEVLRSGRLSLGPRVARFEELFAAQVGAAHASAVSSGTAGLHLALRAVGVGEGDEVVTSPFSFVASRERGPLRAGAAGVRRYRPGHAQPRPGAAAAAVAERTRALLPVHIFGYPADLPAFERVAGARLAIVEDACEALGARHPTAWPSAGAAIPRCSGSTRTSS